MVSTLFIDEENSKLPQKYSNCVTFLEFFTHIINQSMSTGLVPKHMKIAKVIPIFKSGNKHIFKNYRPISLLPAFSKILEKGVATKLLKYLDTFDIFYKHQYGFRPRHSTLHPINHLLNQIEDNNDKTTKELILAVFIESF